MSTPVCYVFFFNDTATTEIYTLSLHDALPISKQQLFARTGANGDERASFLALGYHMAVKPRLLGRRYKGYKAPLSFPCKLLYILMSERDRKSTRLNSSHGYISYAVFCLKKKKKTL